MSIESLSNELKLLHEELTCLRAAEDHIQDKIDDLLAELNHTLNKPQEIHEHSEFGDLPKLLRRFEAEHPELTGNINRVMVTLGNMGI